MKRIISLLLVLVLVIGMLPLPVLAASVSITTQPKSVKVLEGQTAKVTVKASGTGLTYKWYYKDAGATKYTYTSSFKGNSYSVTMNDARDGRYVYCKVYDKYGNMVKSKTVSLRMAEPASIIQQPKSVKVANGAKATVTVKAAGEGLTYKWYYKNPGATKYTYTSSFKGNSYSITMNAERDGRYVYCKVYDKYGTVVKSKTVSLRMTPSVTIKSQSSDFKDVVTNDVSLYVAFTGGVAPYKVVWQKTDSKGVYQNKRTDTVTDAVYDGAYYSEYNFMLAQSDAGKKFRAIITDAKGNTLNSKVITCTKVMPTLSITQHPTDQYAGLGEKVTFTVKAQGADVSYRWYYKNIDDNSFTRVTGLNSNTYSFTMTEDTIGRQVYVKVIENWDLEEKFFTLEKSSNKACAYCDDIQITADPEDWYGYEYDNATFSVSVAGGKAPYTYEWFYTVDGGPSIAVPDSNTSTLVLEEVEASVLDEGRAYYCVVTDATGDWTLTESAELGQVLQFGVPMDEVPYIVSPGQTVEFWADVVGGKGPYTYQWQYTALGGNVFYDVTESFGNRVSGLGTDTLTLVVINVDFDHQYTYRCVITDARGETIITPAVTLERE